MKFMALVESLQGEKVPNIPGMFRLADWDCAEIEKKAKTPITATPHPEGIVLRVPVDEGEAFIFGKPGGDKILRAPVTFLIPKQPPKAV
jgi:hypothetical protein